MERLNIIELGGSIISKEDEEGKHYYDTEGAEFFTNLMNSIPKHEKVIAIIGGGKKASQSIQKQNLVQRKSLGIDLETDLEDLPFLQSRMLRHTLDYFGILATHQNSAAFIDKLGKIGLDGVCPQVLKNPFVSLPKDGDEHHRVYVAGGFKPGATTDAVAAYFAETTNAGFVHKVSDFEIMKDISVAKYKKEKHNDYHNLYSTTFDHIATLVGDKNNMIPGGSYPLDPKAVSLYKKLTMRSGFENLTLNVGKLNQLEKMLSGVPFTGTVVKK